HGTEPVIWDRRVWEGIEMLSRYRKQASEGRARLDQARAAIGESQTLLAAVLLARAGGAALSEGQLPEADEALLRRALSIQEKLAPDSRPVAVTHNFLGYAALLKGDLAAAET